MILITQIWLDYLWNEAKSGYLFLLGPLWMFELKFWKLDLGRPKPRGRWLDLDGIGLESSLSLMSLMDFGLSKIVLKLHIHMTYLFFLGTQNQVYKAHNIQTIMIGPSVELGLTMAQTMVKHTQYAMQF